MSTVNISVSDLTVKQTLHEILLTLLRLENSASPNDEFFQEVAEEINLNTLALSGLSTHPPEMKERTMTDPTTAVTDALAAQTQAIANLASELATEHEQWLAAVEAGDEEQAAAIVAEVEKNTAQLTQMSEDLAASTPDATIDNTLPEEQPVVDNTLPEEPTTQAKA